MLGQVKVDEKSNEIKAIPELLRRLDLQGCLVTIDAMGCQVDIADLIVEQGGDYLFSLKGNQSNLHEDVVLLFDDLEASDYRAYAYTSIALNGAGLPIISYFDDTNDALKVAVCHNLTCTNRTRTTVDSAGVVGTHTSLALDSSDFPVISYYDSSNTSLKLAVCFDATCSTLIAQTTVDNSGDVGTHTSMVLNRKGYPIISYRDASNTALKLAVCHDAYCTSPSLTLITVDDLGDVGTHTSLALNSSGHPVISYRDEDNGDMKVAVCNDVTCTNPTLTIVDGPDDVGTFTSLALDSRDHPVISYYDQMNDDLKLAICDSATCTNPTLTIVDSSTDDAGQFTSLALNSRGYPVISYYAFDNGIFWKVAVCNSVTCTSPTLTTVSRGGFVPAENSLALNGSDHPVISYYDVTHGNLKIAICNDALCSNLTLTTVDNTGDVGTYTSLALDRYGYPVVSYYDDTNGDLKLVSYSTGDSSGSTGTYLPLIVR